MGRAYVNFYANYVANRDFAAGEPYFADGVAYCDDHDISTYSIFLRSERTSMLERTGRWDEAVAIAEELLRWGGPSPSIRLCPLNRLGTIRSRRGDPGVWECLDEAIEYAIGAGEPLSIVPVRLTRAEAYWLEGDAAAAVREAELADDHAASCDCWERGAVAVWLKRTGSSRGPRGILAEPYRRQLDSDWEGAARLWTGLGCWYEAALALLGSSEEDALREALKIFTDLGASATARVTRQKMRLLASGQSGPARGPRRSSSREESQSHFTYRQTSMPRGQTLRPTQCKNEVTCCHQRAGRHTCDSELGQDLPGVAWGRTARPTGTSGRSAADAAGRG